ncbi:MAG: AAA family ATPase, partial [archaeon]
GENIFKKELDRETVFRDKDAISPHFIPKELPFREKQINEITKNLAPALKGKKPNNLFLYGKTGSGKTVVTKHVTGELMDYAKKNKEGVKCFYVNCRNHNSKYKVMIKAVKEAFPEENFLGYSAGFIHDKLIEFINEGKQLVMVLDEIDKVKDLDELIYSLSRSNDEVNKGGLSLIGISNNLMFKDRLDPRTKSSLCEEEMVFPPYNAEELRAILKQRVELAFKKGTVEETAINLTAAFAAQESGDARTAVMLLQRAGEFADSKGVSIVGEKEVEESKKKVEEEVIFNMISTLPEQQQLVLKAIADLSLHSKGIRRITGREEFGVLYSGEIYDRYKDFAKNYNLNVVSSRWYRQYINELEMYGLIVTTSSGKGIKGQTRLIKLGFDAKKISNAIEKELER